MVAEVGPRPRSVSLALVLLAAGLVLSLISSVVFITAFVRDPPPELALDWDNLVLLVWLGVLAVLQDAPADGLTPAAEL